MNTRSFFINAFLFILPLLVFFIFPFWILYLGDEFSSADERVQLWLSGDNTTLVGSSYISPSENLPLRMVEIIKPEVLAIGDSRILQLREEFFNIGVTFYNGSDMGVGFGPLVWDGELWKMLPDGYAPDILIVNLGQNFFRRSFTEGGGEQNIFAISEKPNYLYVVRNVYFDYFRGKFTLRELFVARQTERYIGVDALSHGTGRRKDGSFRQGYIIENPDNPDLEDYRLQDTFKRIENGSRLFEHDADISAKRVEALKTFLTEAKKRGIHVVVFLPPVAPSAYKKMYEMGPESYGYIAKILPAIKPALIKLDFSIFDFTDSSTIGSSDEEFLDGAHGSEKVYLRFLITVAQRDAKAGRYLNADRLKKILQENTHNLIVFK